MNKFPTNRYMAKLLKKRSIRCLHKMRIMEDVKEGCMIQPSSPGHAELRPDNDSREGSCRKSNESLNESFQEDCDNKELNSVKEEINAKTPDISQDNDTDSDPHNSLKRKQNEEDAPSKRFSTEIEENLRQRDKILNEFMEVLGCDSASIDQLQLHSEQLLAEIRTLNDLAREKEMEWNNIIHLKKIKEELLIRIDRKRQISIVNGEKTDSDGDHEENHTKSSNRSLLKFNLSRSPKYTRNNRNTHLLPKALHLEMNGSYDPRQGTRNRPILDVQSIIADYRQRHPEAVPRRGRRIRNSQNGSNRNSSILNFSSLTLGSGAQVKQNMHDMGNELNMLLNAIDANREDTSRRSSAESSQNIQDVLPRKDILLQFAKLSQNERNELIQNAMKPPPPYPEVTVHPVITSTVPPTNSLLHGILTKARNEITITPVGNEFEQPAKGQKAAMNVEDDETEDSADRLVIDESNEDVRRPTDNNSDTGDEVPQCQGCNQRTAQFVCAGCGNQWYCSRDCQVAAWDEHSEVCSG